jgi:hypothetical protein
MSNATTRLKPAIHNVHYGKPCVRSSFAFAAIVLWRSLKNWDRSTKWRCASRGMRASSVCRASTRERERPPQPYNFKSWFVIFPLSYADDCLVDRCTQHRCFIVATCDKVSHRRLFPRFSAAPAACSPRPHCDFAARTIERAIALHSSSTPIATAGPQTPHPQDPRRPYNVPTTSPPPPPCPCSRTQRCYNCARFLAPAHAAQVHKRKEIQHRAAAGGVWRCVVAASCFGLRVEGALSVSGVTRFCLQCALLLLLRWGVVSHRAREWALLQPWQALRYNRPYIFCCACIVLSLSSRSMLAWLTPLQHLEHNCAAK